MRTRTPRTIITGTLTTGAAVTAAAAVLALAGPATAAAPTSIKAEYWGVSCVTALAGGDTLFLTGSGTTDGAEGGVSAFIETIDGGYDEGTSTSWEFGDTFAATVPIGAHTFTIGADAATGERTTQPVHERDGNRWTRGTTTFADLLLTGVSATYDGRSVELGEGACNGDITAFDLRTTNPTAYVTADRDFGSDICDVEGLPDGQVRLSGRLPDVLVEVVLDHGETAEKAVGELRLVGRRGTVGADVVDLGSGEATTTAHVDLALRRSGPAQRVVESADGFTERRTVTPFLATVDVVLADGRSGMATCAAIAVSTQLRVKPGR
ncbi:hypothetical protein ACFQ0K_11305 [Nocardioides caeni]|uniref:Htaa domain-containing protein n=1 Tax=Nocardioides caeni TaxID=574700 RepID=A0A4V4HLE2_9ACTN|nr:hypothetical protein [Nocardioides caeni]THV17956.1 hypothetical protein E9934_05765 [Nocardioides caeni]